MKFEYWIVENEPVPVKDMPSNMGNIINAYPVGYKIPVVAVDSGWLKTTSGTFVFITENVISFRDWKFKHQDDEVPVELIDPNIPKELKHSFRALISGAVQAGDTIKIKNDTKDLNTGNVIKEGDTKYTVIGVDPQTQQIQYGVITKNNNNTETLEKHTVSMDDVQVLDTSGKAGDENVWTDVSASATIANDKEIEEQKRLSDLRSRFEAIFAGNNAYGNLHITSMRQAIGIPYQFLPTADPRISDDGNDNDQIFADEKFGRKFAQKIAARAPILIMQAGQADFLNGYSEEERSIFMDYMLRVGSAVDNDLSALINKPGMYYTLRPMPTQYYNAVDNMCRTMAVLLGLGDVEYSTNWNNGGENIFGATTLGNFHWMQTELSAFGFNQGSVAFYINSDPQIQESMSNSTTQSSLAQKANQLGAMGSELQFLMGGMKNTMGTAFGLDSVLKDADAIAQQKYSDGAGIGGVLDSFIGSIQTLIAGGRMSFPEIWQDHQFSRSYNVTIKLDSPDCDNLSIFLNILVPLAHILAFCLPRYVGQNNYVCPFLIRAFYKSMFNIPLGIVESCSIQKGDVGAWTQNGLPTQVTINLTIKDLYRVISIVTGMQNSLFSQLLGGSNTILANPGQLDYVANLCGVNIDEPDLVRSFKLWMTLKNPFTNFLGNLSYVFSQVAADVYGKWYRLTNWI